MAIALKSGKHTSARVASRLRRQVRGRKKVAGTSERPRLVASVVYYGSYWGDFLTGSTAPLLGHFAEHDDYEPAESVQELEQAFRDAGRAVTIHTYPGTGHWFAEPSRDAYRADASDLAFERTLTFLEERLGPSAA